MAIALDDVLLPPNVLVESLGGLLTDTAVSASQGGIEKRDPWLSVPLEQFSLKFFSSDAELIARIFRNALGKVRAFLVEDLDDNAVSNVELVKVTAGGVTTCQLRQTYPITKSLTDLTVVATAYRPVYRFPDGALSVTVNDVAVTEGVDFTEADGLLTFTSLITDPVRATLTKFYKAVRFDTDELITVWQGVANRDVQSVAAIAVLF